MTLKTVPVTGTLYKPDGSVAANASVTANLTTVDTDGGVVVPASVTTTSDSSGVFTLNLWPNSRGVNGSQYLVRAQMPGALSGVLLMNLRITVPDSDPTVPVPIETITNRKGPDALSDATAAMRAAQGALVQLLPVLNDLGNINAVSAALTNLNAIAADLGSLNSVADDLANIDALAGIISTLNAVAGDLTNINAVAADKVNIDAVASALSNINTCVTNITAIQNAAGNAQSAAASLADLKNRYMGAYAADPTTRPDGSALTVGCSYFNTTSNLFKVYNGATFQASDINTANLAASSGSSLVGWIQSLTGAVATTLQAKARELLSFKDKGADNTGATDASAAITAVFAEGQSSNRPVRVGGEAYKITSPLLLPYHVMADWGNATVDATGIGAGQWAITAKNLSGGTNLQRASQWNGLYLNLGSSGAYGLLVDAPTWAVSNFMVQTMNIIGGAIGIGFGSNVWLTHFRNAQVSGQSSIGLWAKFGTNAGENVTFEGVIANVSDGAGGGIGVKTEKGTSDAALTLMNTSIDYCDKGILHTNGQLFHNGGHVEQSGANPLVTLSQQVGQGALSYEAKGVRYVRNAAATLTSIIQVNGSALVNISGGEAVDLNNNPNLEFITVASGAPSIRHDNVNWNLFPNISSDQIGRISDYTSLTRNGNFENATPLLGWYMDAVNFNRNSAFAGGVSGTIGAGGAWPTNMAQVGGLSGLNQPTLTFASTGGKPVMQVHFTGTPTATATIGVYFDNSSGVLSQQGDLWTSRCYARLLAAASGVVNYNLQVTERDAGGAALTSSSQAFTPTTDRQLYAFSYQVQNAAAHHLQQAFFFSFTNGVPVDVTLEFECPSMMLRPMVYKDIYRNDTGTTLPTYRAQLDTTNGRTAAQCLKLLTSQAETVDVYSIVPAKTDDWLFMRGYGNIGAITSGAIGVKVSWRDYFDNEISNQAARGDNAYLTAAGAGYKQQSGVRVAPTGTVNARVCCHLEAANGGPFYFDDMQAWVIRG